MTSEHELRQQAYRDTQDTETDAEGVDTGSTEMARSFDRTSQNDNDVITTQPNGTEMNSKGEVVSEPGIEGEPSQSGPISLPNVEAVKTGNGYSYYFIAPPEAVRLGWPERQHLGDDDGKGMGLAAISGQAVALSDRLTKEVIAVHDREIAQAANHRLREDGENEDEELMPFIAGHAASHGGQTTDQNAYLYEEATGDTALADEKNRSHTSPEDDPLSVSEFHAPEHHKQPVDRPAPEEISIEAAGSPEVSPSTDDRVENISAGIPQEARDTPQPLLDPQKPKQRVLGVIPPGEHVAEMQYVPGQPKGPELEPT